MRSLFAVPRKTHTESSGRETTCKHTHKPRSRLCWLGIHAWPTLHLCGNVTMLRKFRTASWTMIHDHGSITEKLLMKCIHSAVDAASVQWQWTVRRHSLSVSVSGHSAIITTVQYMYYIVKSVCWRCHRNGCSLPTLMLEKFTEHTMSRYLKAINSHRRIDGAPSSNNNNSNNIVSNHVKMVASNSNLEPNLDIFLGRNESFLYRQKTPLCRFHGQKLRTLGLWAKRGNWPPALISHKISSETGMYRCVPRSLSTICRMFPWNGSAAEFFIRQKEF